MTSYAAADDHGIPMFVYGIRCSPNDLYGIHVQVTADYYTDYSLLVFPSYTKPPCLNSHGYLSPNFWQLTRLLIENPKHVRAMEFEDPYITESESALVEAMRDYYPSLKPEWYYVPRIF